MKADWRTCLFLNVTMTCEGSKGLWKKSSRLDIIVQFFLKETTNKGNEDTVEKTFISLMPLSHNDTQSWPVVHSLCSENET